MDAPLLYPNHLIPLWYSIIVLALIPTFRETAILIIDEREKLKQIPNLTLSSIGWLLTTFSILHLYPPKQILLKIKAV